MKILVFCSALLFSIVQLAHAHPGRTDSDGCHKNSKTGVEHCEHGDTSKVVIPTNDAPTSFFITKPSTGMAPLILNLDAKDSFDLDGTITTYKWTVSNGQTTSGETSSLTFDQASVGWVERQRNPPQPAQTLLHYHDFSGSQTP
jgi:hypothetical protein